jgi:hypothetical protein
MNRPARPFWGLLAAGAATAVGLTTRDAGFVVITFFGSLWVPRLLGLRAGHGACHGHHAGRRRLEDRMAEWHRQAHGEAAGSPPGAAPVA